MSSECDVCRDAAFVSVEATRYSEKDEPYLTADIFVELAKYCPRCGREIPFSKKEVA